MPQHRIVAIWLHQHRHDAIDVSARFVQSLTAAGLRCAAPPQDAALLRAAGAWVDDLTGDPAEVAIIFGGDGSILRAGEWALPLEVPLLGVNLGHIGFLAELERSDLDDLATAVVERRYDVEERLSLEVDAFDPDGVCRWSSFSVNEVSIEKAARERMIEVLVEIDGIPLSRWGCDGVLVASPTGSTAYAFSAGGPIVWPDVEALLVVPLSAHALFSSPVVVAPRSTITAHLIADATSDAVVWCDGRRSTGLQPGWQVQVHRCRQSLRLARLSEQPFTERLVRKFGLHVEGWRGQAEQGPACSAS